MPKIDINAAPNVSSLISTRRASSADFGGGAGLQQAGADITAFGKQMEQTRKQKQQQAEKKQKEAEQKQKEMEQTQRRLKAQADRETAMQIETAFIEARSKLQQSSLEAEKNAPAGAAGFAENRIEEFNGVAETIREQFQNASTENKLRLEQGAARLGGWYSNKAMVFEANARARKLRRDVETGLGTINKSVLDGSMSVEDARDASFAMISATGLSADARESMMEDQNENIAASDYSNRMRAADTPQEILALKDDLGKNKAMFSQAGYNKLLSDMDTAVDTLGRRNQEEDRADLVRDIQSGSTGGPMGVYSAEEINAMYPGRPAKAQRAIAAYNNAVRQQTVMSGVATASVVDVARTAADLQKKVDTAVSADARLEAEDNLTAFKQAASRRQTEIDKNPVAYAMKNFPLLTDMKQQWDDARKAADEAPDDDILGDQAEAVRDKYVGSMDAVQARLGVISPDILTDNQIEAYGVQIDEALRDTGDGKGAARILQTLDSLQNTWGSGAHWSRVADQLVRKKAITGGHVALAWMDPVKDHTARIKLADALAVPQGEWKKSIPSGFGGDLHTAVVSQMEDFTLSMSNGGGARGVKLSGNMYEAVSALAKQMYTKDGGTAEDAAKNAYDTLLGGKFKYFGDGRARVPVADGVPFDLVVAGAGYYKRELISAADIRVPVNDLTARGGEMDREAYLSSVASNARWVNSGDGTGLTLIGPDGLAMAEIDDPDPLGDDENPKYVPLTRTWEELTTVANTMPITTGERPATARTVGTKKPGIRTKNPDRVSPLRGGPVK